MTSRDLIIYTSRESVAAGDDLSDHYRTMTISYSPILSEVLSSLVSTYQLPRISGGKATWIVSCPSRIGHQFPFDAIAVLAQQWKQPKLLVSPDTEHNLDADGSMRVVFRYMAQKPPGSVLKALRLLAR